MGGCIGKSSKSKNNTLGLKAPKMETDHKYKVVILGDIAVGKTSILSMLKGK